ncbi:MAG: RsmB/NOP family class I SAM-dependent RNA methyltransferase [Propionibacteriaceae bacterium]|jgi:16S rRNA (cytosine967-C5)-methyltransferase|nr:RsmB/NOP family class I SAM-dependent RNA methyltransferase [Propionibacteriaceae bacterium]
MGRSNTSPSSEARRVAYDVLRRVTADGAYANLALAHALAAADLSPRDAAFTTTLVAGTCRGLGVYDEIIARASGRSLTTLQPAVIDLLRLGVHQALSLRVPPHAAVATTVDLAAATVGRRVMGLVNAILRRVTAKTYDEWLAELTAGAGPLAALALRTSHPVWIAQAYADRLGDLAEAEAALQANNEPPTPVLAIRPGLLTRDELLAEAGKHAQPGRWSPYAVRADGDPGRVPSVQAGRAGVEDEGSQLVALALAAADAPDGPWLDLCAGPGGKTALLAGLAAGRGVRLVATEANAQRAQLVRENLRAYRRPPEVTVADGRRPPFEAGSFARVLVDAPCTGLGALRRRPEARWRKSPADLAQLVTLQRELLDSALRLVRPGGVVAYVTCSPHRAETADVVGAALDAHPGVTPLPAAPLLPGSPPGAADGPYAQLWGHRHGTDAMFLALLRAPGAA